MEKHETVNLGWTELVNEKMGHCYNNEICFKQSLFIKKCIQNIKCVFHFTFLGTMRSASEKRGWPI